MKIETPFTPEQVKHLQSWQDGKYHPFTCDESGCNNRSLQPNGGALIPTEEGWVCPCGKYKQNWAHDFMATDAPPF